MRKAILLFSTLLLLTSGTQALAWNDLGHRTTASVAYQDLSTVDRAKVVSILRQFSFYDQWMARKPDGMPEAEYLFMRAATWPDDIRGNNTYHIWDAHFINYKFNPAHPDQNSPLPHVGTNIEKSFAQRWLEVSDAGTNPEERAIALCWVFHLVGDIHQPLHSTALVNQDHPSGDEGGNRFWVRNPTNSKKVKLHSYWDGLLGALADSTPPEFAAALKAARSRAAGLRSGFKRGDLHELAKTKFKDWSRESLAEAKKVAYDSGNLNGKPGIGQDNNPPADPPSLTSGYADKALGVAERRATLAGYRLADLIRKVP